MGHGRGGYELALAADHIMLIDDGASAVSLQVPLLAVLPGQAGSPASLTNATFGEIGQTYFAPN